MMSLMISIYKEDFMQDEEQVEIHRWADVCDECGNWTMDCDCEE